MYVGWFEIMNKTVTRFHETTNFIIMP